MGAFLIPSKMGAKTSNMINSFKYVFVETKSSWSIGSFHHFLSFSSDGTTIAGTKKGAEEDQDQFWETATGAATSSFEHSSFVVFSPTDPDIAVLVRSESVHMMKRDSFGGKMWGGQYKHNITRTQGAVCTFNSDGKTIVASWFQNDLCKYDVTTWSSRKTASTVYDGITSVVCCPIKPGWFVVCSDRGHLDIVSNATKHIKSHFRLTPVDPVRVSACAWSQDGNWIATGNDVGDIFLWNGGVPIRVSFAMQLPRNRPNTPSGPTTSLVFVPDSSALIILSGGYLSVWDIKKVKYVANSGLPDTAMNIALDGSRNRLAVAVNERITIYELKLAEQICQMDGKSSIPSELAKFNITNAVQAVNFNPEPYIGPHFVIYRGTWKLDTPRIFKHVVAIKVLRPVFIARDSAHEQAEFEDRLLKFLTRWAELTHDNLVPLLGVSAAFGEFPAVITTWMTNGLLSEYIKTDEQYNQMQLVIGVARGVAYLHSENIVHSDIRGSGVLVDDFGQARLADPGLLCVLANGPSRGRGTMKVPYRWMAPELLENLFAKATFATDVYSVTMTSLEIFTAGDPFRNIPNVFQFVVVENKRPDRPYDVDDELWSLWGEGWNQDAAMRPDMESYVERLNQML